MDQRHFLKNNFSLWTSQGFSRLCESRSHLRKTVMIGVCPVPDQSVFRMILIIFATSVSRFPKRSLRFRIAYQNLIFVYHIFCACCISAHLFLTNVSFVRDARCFDYKHCQLCLVDLFKFILSRDLMHWKPSAAVHLYRDLLSVCLFVCLCTYSYIYGLINHPHNYCSIWWKTN